MTAGFEPADAREPGDSCDAIEDTHRRRVASYHETIGGTQTVKKTVKRSKSDTALADHDDDPAFDGTLIRNVCHSIEAAGYPQLTAGQFADLASTLHDMLYPQRAEDRDLVDALADVYRIGFIAGRRHGAASARRQAPDPLDEPDMALVDRMRTQVDLLVTSRVPFPGHPVTEDQRRRATALGVALVHTATAHGVNERDLAQATSLPATTLDAIRFADRRANQPTNQPTAVAVD